MMSTPQRRYLQTQLPRMIAHRGLTKNGDENTLAAFVRAVKAGADVIETDTRATSDGIALTFHDSSTGRVSSSDKSIAHTPWKELEGLAIGGGQITRLDEALRKLPGTPFNIDVKSMQAARPTAEAIARANAQERVCLTSFDASIAASARDVLRDLTGHTPIMSASRRTVGAFRFATATCAPQSVIDSILSPVSALQVPRSHLGIPLVTSRTIASAHRSGCEVHVWTIDTPDEMSMLLNMGVDGIVTNRVDVLARVLARGEKPVRE